MRKRDRRALGEYIRWAADRIELRDWYFELEHDPAPEGCNGHISIAYGRKVALISFTREFRTFSSYRQTQIVVHELVHCHLEPAGALVRNNLEEHLGKAADKLFWEAFKQQIEYAVDALADAIAKDLPPIKWPK